MLLHKAGSGCFCQFSVQGVPEQQTREIIKVAEAKGVGWTVLSRSQNQCATSVCHTPCACIGCVSEASLVLRRWAASSRAASELATPAECLGLIFMLTAEGACDVKL